MFLGFLLIFTFVVSAPAPAQSPGNLPPTKKNSTFKEPRSAAETEAPANDTKRNQNYREILKRQWLIPMPKAEYERLSRRFKGLSMFDTDERPWVIPGVSLMTPTGFCAKWGDIFTGLGITNRGRYTDNPDGSYVVGFGLGDPVSWLGFELTVTFLNMRRFLNSGKSISAKVSHTFADTTSLSVGKIDFLQFPRNAADTGTSNYLALSRAFQLTDDPTDYFSLAVATLGVGDGQFKTDEQVIGRIPSFGVFGSLSLRVAQPLNLIANWDQNLHLGASIAPFRRFPFILSIGALDFLQRNNSKGVRFLFGFSYSDSVFSQSFPVGWFRGNRL